MDEMLNKLMSWSMQVVRTGLWFGLGCGDLGIELKVVGVGCVVKAQVVNLGAVGSGLEPSTSEVFCGALTMLTPQHVGVTSNYPWVNWFINLGSTGNY